GEAGDENVPGGYALCDGGLRCDSCCAGRDGHLVAGGDAEALAVFFADLDAVVAMELLGLRVAHSSGIEGGVEVAGGDDPGARVGGEGFDGRGHGLRGDGDGAADAFADDEVPGGLVGAVELRDLAEGRVGGLREFDA